MRFFRHPFLTRRLRADPVLGAAAFGGHLADNRESLFGLADWLERHDLVDLVAVSHRVAFKKRKRRPAGISAVRAP